MSNIRDWMDYSHGDLNESRLAGLPRTKCFNAQQSIEKALKAALILEKIDFKCSHDLQYLKNLLPDNWAAKQTAVDLPMLEKYSCKQTDELQFFVPDENKTDDAVCAAKQILNKIDADFEKYFKLKPDEPIKSAKWPENNLNVGNETQAKLEKLKKAISIIDPLKIILFGSHARGDANADSDIDLLVITDKDADTARTEIYKKLEKINIYPDLVIVDLDDFNTMSNICGYMIYYAAREGVIL